MIFNRKRFVAAAFILIVLLLAACDHTKGSLTDNIAPTVKFTAYEGIDADGSVNYEGAAIPESEDSILVFQQKVYWLGSDVDGVVKDYRYRLINKNGEYITVAGHENRLSDAEGGWLLHVINNDESQISDWTNDVYAVINFPCWDNPATHDSAKVATAMELQCRDDRGDVSPIVRRIFITKSNKPSIDVTTSKGGLNRKDDPFSSEEGATIVAETGTGIKFNFSMQDNDAYVSELKPWYFEYRFIKRDIADTTNYTYPGGEEWHTTLGQENVKSVIVSASDEYGENLLIPDAHVGYTQDEITTETVMQVRGYDEAGVVSDIKEVYFRCLSGYHPWSLMYCNADTNDVFCLGEYHYSYGLNALVKVVKPKTGTVYDGEHFAHPLFWSQDSTFSAIWSDDFVMYTHAGYKGEFANGKPTGKRENIVLDEQTGKNYYSEAIGIAYQLDGEAYQYAAYLGNPEYYPYGTEGSDSWFKLKIGEPLAQALPIRNLTPGEHVLSIRVLDSQGVWDDSPYEFKFTLIENLPAAERPKDILVIDNDEAPYPPSAEENRDEFYQNLFSGYNVDFINYDDVKEGVVDAGQEALQYSKAKFSPSDLMQYKTIFFHMDHITSASQDLFLENQSFNLFLQGGGNLILSGGINVNGLQEAFNYTPRNIVKDHMGIPSDIPGLESDGSDAVIYCDIVSSDQMKDRFFTGASPAEGSGLTVSVEIDTTENAVGGLIHGINDDATGLVSYFNTANLENVHPVMNMVYTDKYLDTADSTSVALYESTMNKACAIEFDRLNYATGTVDAKTYVFGFPISFMKFDQAKALMEEVLSEMGINK
ncbi:MAG: hypothetical protein CSB55_02610 [Candidatus Cloacimonadota bacterium]|nr:MAG: hypothetical protein CSB55_02610 [Candidatus Cloacimonadota bacterium]